MGRRFRGRCFRFYIFKGFRVVGEIGMGWFGVVFYLVLDCGVECGEGREGRGLL